MMFHSPGRNLGCRWDIQAGARVVELPMGRRNPTRLAKRLVGWSTKIFKVSAMEVGSGVVRVGPG